MSGYAISRDLSHLALNDLDKWHLMAYYLHKIIPAKIWYKTYNAKRLAIVEEFKIWKHYLEGCKHKLLVLIDYSNF